MKHTPCGICHRTRISRRPSGVLLCPVCDCAKCASCGHPSAFLRTHCGSCGTALPAHTPKDVTP